MNQLLSKFLKNHEVIVGFVSIIYATASVFSASQLIKNGYSTDLFHQYFDILVIAGLFGVVWSNLSEIAQMGHEYAKKIRSSREAPAFGFMSNALLVLMTSLVLTAFLNVFRVPPANFLYQLLTIVIYYTSGLLAVVYFYFIGKAGKTLANYVKKSKQHRQAIVVIGIILGATCLFAWVVVTKSGVALQNDNHVLSYLPSPFVFVTLYIPLIAGWVYGLSGAYGFYLYQRYTFGSIYRHSMLGITFGIILLVLVSSTRHISDFAIGSASQVSLPEEFPRVLVLFTILISAVMSIRYGVAELVKIEKVTK